MRKEKQKSKVQRADFLEVSELVSFRNNEELVLNAYSNGNLTSVEYNPETQSFILDNDPDIETVIRDRAVGFLIKH